MAVAVWTMVSRITGFGRVAAIAAVLGPTYLGNTFQATNLLPNLTYEFLTGSLFGTLLVPPLTRHVDMRDRRAVERLAGGFLGVVVVCFVILTAIVVLAGPLLLGLFTLGVETPEVAAAQRRVGWILLAMLMPQVVLYGLAGTGGAVQNAHGRFALAAAAPTLENLGVMATMAAAYLMYGTDATLTTVVESELILLGLGTTASVGLHATVQWWGAHRVGVDLLPRAGWQNAEVRQTIRRAVPSLGYSGLNALRVFAALVIANRVAGGVVAFQLALNFFHLPSAIGARPVAVAALPELARLHHRREMQGFHDALVKGARLVAFATIPAAVACLVLAGPLARAASFGQMAAGRGVALVTVSLAALAPGVLGESAFILLTHASYARHDAFSPFRSMAVRTVVSIGGMALSFFFTGSRSVLVGLGLALSAGNISSAIHLQRRVRTELPPAKERLRPNVLRTLAAAVAMVFPAYITANAVASRLSGSWGDLVAMIVATAVGIMVFIAMQMLWGSSELTAFRTAGAQFRSRETL